MSTSNSLLSPSLYHRHLSLLPYIAFVAPYDDKYKFTTFSQLRHRILVADKYDLLASIYVPKSHNVLVYKEILTCAVCQAVEKMRQKSH
jgi:hypothetical protein